MRIRQLGSTGLTVTPLGLGLAALGRPGYINLGRDADLGRERSVAAMEQRCHDLLDLAREAGIRYVDTARSYGLAEQFLASWLQRRGVGTEQVAVGSKWGYTYTGEWRLDSPVHEVKDLSVATLRRQVEESRRLLGRHLQLYQIHSATLDSGVLDDEEVLNALARLRAEGLAIGLTVSGPRQADSIRQALGIRVDGRFLFQVVQATWNLLEVSAGATLAEAHAHGLGVIIKEALANGRLTDRGSDPETALLRARAAAIGTSVDVLALAGALAQPWVDVVLSGAVTIEQLLQNVLALDHLEQAATLPAMAMAPAEYWSRRSALPWG